MMLLIMMMICMIFRNSSSIGSSSGNRVGGCKLYNEDTTKVRVRTERVGSGSELEGGG